MEGKNPVSNLKSESAKRSGISDKEHHAISSNTDANSVMLDGSKYDKDYDKLTDAVGYVDPDATITTSK